VFKVIEEQARGLSPTVVFGAWCGELLTRGHGTRPRCGDAVRRRVYEGADFAGRRIKLPRVSFLRGTQRTRTSVVPGRRIRRGETPRPRGRSAAATERSPLGVLQRKNWERAGKERLIRCGLGVGCVLGARKNQEKTKKGRGAWFGGNGSVRGEERAAQPSNPLIRYKEDGRGFDRARFFCNSHVFCCPRALP